ncbi:hypothetical protein HG531_007104 [Fusarium graminearum]|nr:hypothetical protein HG531_007104 [Fusarium graminearum]
MVELSNRFVAMVQNVAERCVRQVNHHVILASLDVDRHIVLVRVISRADFFKHNIGCILQCGWKLSVRQRRVEESNIGEFERVLDLGERDVAMFQTVEEVVLHNSHRVAQCSRIANVGTACNHVNDRPNDIFNALNLRSTKAQAA